MGARGAVRASLKESRATDVAPLRQCFLGMTGGRAYWRAGFELRVYGLRVWSQRLWAREVLSEPP